MLLEQGIQNWWSQYRPLTEALPVAKFYTGTAPVKLMRDPQTNTPILDANNEPVYELMVDLPFVNLERTGVAESTRTSSGTILESVQCRFDVWDEDLDRAKAVARLIREWFNRADFDYEGGRVSDIKFTGQAESQDNQGTWHVILDAIVRTAESFAKVGAA